jgi:hypothetical protein
MFAAFSTYFFFKACTIMQVYLVWIWRRNKLAASILNVGTADAHVVVFIVSVESYKKLVTQSVIIWHSETLQIGICYMPWGHPLFFFFFFVYLTQLLNTTRAYGNSWSPRLSGMHRV